MPISCAGLSCPDARRRAGPRLSAVPSRSSPDHRDGTDSMKLVIAIIKPFKLDEVRDALTAVGVHGMTVDRGEGLRPPEGPHRNLSRRRIRRELPAQDPDRGRGRRPTASTRWSRPSPTPPRPARSATARSSSPRSIRRCASAPARPIPTRSKRRRNVAGGASRQRRRPCAGTAFDRGGHHDDKRVIGRSLRHGIVLIALAALRRRSPKRRRRRSTPPTPPG